LWCLFLLGVGWVSRGVVKDRLEERISEALLVDAYIDDLSFNLLTGTVRIRGLAIARKSGGLISVEIEEAEVQLPRFGRVLLDRRALAVHVRGAIIIVSPGAMANLVVPRRQKKPLRLEEFSLERARLSVAPSKEVPDVPAFVVTIEKAHAKNSMLSSGLSWLTGLRELSGEVSVGGHRLAMKYDGQSLHLRAKSLGTMPLLVPFTMPALSADALEPEQLRAMQKQLALSVLPRVMERLVKKRAIKRFLPGASGANANPEGDPAPDPNP
jgi:hypothetical protein